MVLDQFEGELKNALEGCIAKFKNEKIFGDSNWTYGIKEALADLGKNKLNEICTSGFTDKYNSEWLYDMVWYKENEKGQLINIELVIESEWGSSMKNIKFDFEKLLLANSKYHLMICQAYFEDMAALNNYFKEAINCYQLNRIGDRYMIAILDKREETFEYFVFVKI